MDENKNMLSSIPPKTAMILGLVIGILGMCTIGFIFLSVKLLRGEAFLGTNGSNNQVVADNNQGIQQPGNTQQPTPTPSAVNVAAGHFPLLGKANAPVTVIEFADFRCPFCERFYQDSEKSILKDYVATGKVKFAFRSFAFLGQASTWASEAAECANEQGKFWPMHNWFYEHQADESNTDYYSKANLIKYATGLGMNGSQFSSCLNSDKYASAVASDVSDAQAAGVNGTPTTFVNGKPIVGAVPYATVKAAIEAALQGKEYLLSRQKNSPKCGRIFLPLEDFSFYCTSIEATIEGWILQW